MSVERTSLASIAQVAAARPMVSSWVSANAGSGKTRVLTSRVARLLLHGVEPQKILCLTFTKAAAAEMQNRLFKQLGGWAMLPDADLHTELDALGEDVSDPTQLLRARTLFARALETPGGLKIQTIHAFCESLLHRFPLEAGISPDFSLMDDRQSITLQEQVLDEIALSDEAALDALIALRGRDPADYLQDILKHQHLFSSPFDEALVADTLEVEIGLEADDLLYQVMQGFDDAQLDALAEALIIGAGKHDAVVAQTLRDLAVSPAETALEILENAFLTKSGTPRSTRSFPVKAAKAAFAPALEMVVELVERVAKARNSRLALAALPAAQTLHNFARLFLSAYAKQKTALGRLEFEDLIRKTDALLRDSEMAQWVLYRLDGGIDHILVDEAQDTSPLQWDIIKALAEEIYASAEGSDRQRTVFVVGDEKQSIFSFQGADPAEFERMRNLFDAQLAAIDRPLAQGELLYSFRSAPPIMQLVDEVFKDAGVTHKAVKDTKPGRIEVWPFLETPDKPDSPPWYEPVDQLPASDPALVLARQVADRVSGLLTSHHELPGADRAIRAADFLILVQSRSPLFHAIIKELKSRGVPVAGADQLKVIEELAVRDLLSVLRFAANPGDDLSLAEALRSPLCGISEAELFTLAHGRKGTLWQAMAADHPMLADVLSNADFERPFELLERILTRHHGRKNLIARLGAEASDGIDELLRQALSFESIAIPSLTGFLEWISADDIKVKRQMDDASDQVRVMSTHGAKGLEAPIVILPQTVKKAMNETSPVVVLDDRVALGKGEAASNPNAVTDALEAQSERLKAENQRLLYVAITRAETWLMVAGSGKQDTGYINWYNPLVEAVTTLGGQETPDGLVYEANWSEEVISPASPTTGTVDSEPEYGMVTPPAKSPKPRQPSDLGGAHALMPVDDAYERDALAYGNQIHLLLETLPDIAADDRHARGLQLLANAGGSADPEAVVAEVLAVLGTPALAALFDKDALREVPVSADLPGIGRIAGRIDVLLVGDTITAVDFKSNPAIPASPDETPEGFLRQMGAYRAALAQIWPDKPVKTVICWTNDASLMELPEKLTLAALGRAMTP